ncbi:hypothetical protein TRICI_006352 [Trichomonascus ciferrii]|uniref:Uncharacterized protein n=1 Tax=Trichomonascus ciferrii TaxID=44093 RepID=A0A642UHU1_9ASCO|nr:hypothetical protein TRICI_006352 [Trichomonascus ciferrii]
MGCLWMIHLLCGDKALGTPAYRMCDDEALGTPAYRRGGSYKPPKERHELPSPTKRVKEKDTTSSAPEQEKEKDPTSNTSEQEKKKDTTSSTTRHGRSTAHLDKDFSSLRRPIPGKPTPNASPRKGRVPVAPPPPKFVATGVAPKGKDERGFKQHIPTPKELAALEKGCPTKYSEDPFTESEKIASNSVPRHQNELSPPPSKSPPAGGRCPQGGPDSTGSGPTGRQFDVTYG